MPVQTFIPVPNTWVFSVQHQYRYRTLRWVRYDINTGTGNFGELGTTSQPVPRILVPYRAHAFLVCRTCFLLFLPSFIFLSLSWTSKREGLFCSVVFFASFCYFVLFRDLLVFSFKLASIFGVIGALYADRSFTFFLEYFAIMLVYLFHILRPHHLYQSSKFVQAERILGVLSANYVVGWKEREDNKYFL